MATSKIAAAPTYTITREDGSAVTPQELYDAFMSGTVILELQESGSVTAETVIALDYAGTPGNIMACRATTHNRQITLGGGE